MADIGERKIAVALVHYPVVNRAGETIGSAVTNLDLHDIARAARTYGVDTYWVITPYEDQRDLADQIVRHWTEGHGGRVNPDRQQAMAMVRICADLDEAIAGTTAKWGRRPRVVATSARDEQGRLTYATARRDLEQGEPMLLLFGTAWGLAPEALAGADAVLAPLEGAGEFNHLSVRSAAAIILDRLLANDRM